MVQQYRTGEWDLASQCVVHIGIVLWYFGMSVGNAGHHSVSLLLWRYARCADLHILVEYFSKPLAAMCHICLIGGTSTCMCG